MKKKIYIIQPTYRKMDGKKVKGWTQFNHSFNVPLLSGAVPDDWEKISCIEYFADIDFSTDAGVVILISTGYDIFYTREIADRFRSKGITIIFGSHLDQFSEKLLIKSSDSVFHGSPGKAEMKSMLDDAFNGKLQRVYEFGMDLNYPFDYSSFKGIKMPYIQAIMGMGCKNNCDYCCTAGVYKGKYRMRKLEFVMKDLHAISKLNKYVAFTDSNIYNNILYLRRLCNEIINSKLGIKWGGQATIDIGYDDETLSVLHEAGCRLLFVGFESLSGENLKYMSKNFNPESYEYLIMKIRSYGIKIAGYFMFGLDDDNTDTFDKTWEFIRKNNITFPLLNILLPIPGTAVYDRLKNENRLTFPDENKFDNTKPLYSVPCHKCYFKPKNLTTEELGIKYLELYKKASRLPAIIRRSLSSSLSESFIYFIMNLGLRKEYSKMKAELIG